MKTRLLVDGDGTGDDRRIFLLTKSFMYWYHNRFKVIIGLVNFYQKFPIQNLNFSRQYF